jgi:hypothetical protein
MRFVLLFTCVVLVACSDDSRPVFGSGAWRFHDVDAISNLCNEESHTRTITGEHGDESPEGGTLVVRCSASKLSSGALSFRLVLDNGAGDSIDVRDLRIDDAAPTYCDSILFEVSGAQYQAICTTDEPLEGECQLVGGALDRSASTLTVDFNCRAVPTLGGGSSTCEVSGAGTSLNANLTFDGCSGI